MKSFIALFLELSLIRFLPAHVVVVGYYTNLLSAYIFRDVSAQIPGDAGKSSRCDPSPC